jgi:hypothetical protein
MRFSVGPLAAGLDGADLTHISLGAAEVVRRILVSVRDVNWDTLEPEVLSTEVGSAQDRFAIELEGRHAAGDIDFRWRVSITADAAGTVVYDLTGEAASDFLYNRVGLCVLHPVETCAGAAYRSTSHSAAASGVLPAQIAPQTVIDGVARPLFPACDTLVLRPAAGGEIAFTFTGDLFEMEDQRNWTDDSFKTYCTPASLGGPHAARRAQRFHQRVEARAAGFDIRVREPGEPITVSLGAPSGATVPPIGLAMGQELRVPTVDEAAALTRLGLAHVRADVRIDPGTLDGSLRRAIDTCERLGVALELALHLEAADEASLQRVEQALRARTVTVARVLAFHRDARAETPSETSSAALIGVVRRRLGDIAPVGGGTNMDFAELNRTRPDPAAAQTVAWSVNAQVHASDDASVMETVRGQAATVETARAFCSGCTFAVGPITLRPRFNPAATGPSLPRDPAALPDHVDRRQPTQFAAAWTAGSVASLVSAGTGSLTYFELVGMAGVIAGGDLEPRPDFAAEPGAVFPCYHVLHAVISLRGHPIVECTLSRTGEVAALATTNDLLLANLTAAPKWVHVTGGAATRPVELAPYGVEQVQRDTSAA